MDQFARSELVLGEGSQDVLAGKTVAVFGLGGVGSYATEALCRAGIGRLVLTDDDTVNESNLNRQLYALHSTVGRKKVDVAAERCRDINPNCTVDKMAVFFNEETVSQYDFSRFDYVVDAVDTVAAKVLLAVKCRDAGVPLLMCMGTGNKTDPTRFVVTDLAETSACPLARVMRHELKKVGIEHLCVVYSTETARKNTVDDHGRHAPGSVPFVPPVAGLITAGEVVKYLLKDT